MRLALRAGRRALPLGALALALAALAGPGCAVLRCRPPAPARPAPGYERLRDTLAAVDASGLAGRHIALDPGHGGSFRGALGVGGLAEAEVNLGVALRLRDLLAAHGAHVFLTREGDRDFLAPADSSLAADLAERARRAAAFGPDLFVSIHHNADPRGVHDVNETQTYYKLGDEGPSLDAAQDVHRALVRNVGIRENRVLPGNYHVLRTSEAPALLTETSYITNPDVERRLRLPEKQALEAEAMFVGLARYFARRVPVIEEFEAVEGPGQAGPALRARIAGEFDRAELLVDGSPVEPVRAGPRLSWSPAEPWRSGPHTARLRVRLSGEGAARERRFAFEVRRPWGSLAAEPVAAPGPVAAVRVRALDPWGRIAADTGSVVVRRVAGGGFVPAETTLAVLDGVAWGYFRAAGDQRARETVFRASVPGDSLATAPARPVEFALGATRSPEEPAQAGGWAGWALRMPGDVPLAGAPGTREPDGAALAWLNRDGFAVLPRDPAGEVLVPALPGYRAWPADTALPPRFVPLCGGALHGRRIVLDPEGGGDDAAGQGPGGTRAATLNLECAHVLAGFLAAAGAQVRLTRAGDLALSEVERVQASEAFGAERFLRIAHRAGSPRLGAHPSSVAGRAWAARTAAALAALGRSAPPVTDEAAYVIRQTSCPALLASPGSLGDEASEARLLAPGALRAEAYALFLGLAREWAPDAAWPADSLAVLDDAGRPLAGAPVTLGGTLVLVTDANGRVRFARTEPGPVGVAVEDPRLFRRATLLESSRGTVLTGTAGR